MTYGSSTWYRGPKAIPLLDESGSDTGAIAQIGAARYPLFIISRSGSAYTVEQTLDISDPVAHPHHGYLYVNRTSAAITMQPSTVGNILIPAGGIGFQPFPPAPETGTPNIGVTGTSFINGENSTIYSGVWELLKPRGTAREFYSLEFTSITYPNNTSEVFTDTTGGTRSVIGATITPHSAGTLEQPGIPISSSHFPPAPYNHHSSTTPLLPIQSEQWHKLVLKVGPDAGAVSNGITLKLGTGEEGENAPQSGFSLQVENSSSFAPLTLPADGKIEMPSSSDLYQKLTSLEGLTLFLKRDSTVSELHRLGLDLIPKNSTDPISRIAALDLLPVEVAVDADRDGEITFDQKDKTTAEKPFRFWINDDDDDVDGSGGTYDHVPVVEPDQQNNSIDYIRDLEDLARLAFGINGFWDQIKSGEVQVGFKWSDISEGNPSINIFRQADQSGEAVQYFVDENEAENQSYSGIFGETNASKVISVSGTTSTYFPQSFIDKLPIVSAPSYLLFEGAAKGKGKLNLVLKVNGQEVVCDGPWIKLMDVRQFYTRGRTSLTATQISDPWNSPNPPAITSVPDNTPEFVADPNETEQCIIHVHGWRMTEGDSRSWSEMTFKRLWQLHYKGRFATFRWATFSDDTHPPILGQDLPSKLTYNRSEYRSWLCGPALAQFVNGLPYEGSCYLIAHSMGNVISGKALQTGMNVNRYVMCNAAMAAMSYDPSITNLPLSSSSTPDTDSDPATVAFGLKNRFNDNLTTRINYYLPKDEALASWVANQVLNKPELFTFSGYYYDPSDTPGNKIYYGALPARRNVTSLAEAMGHVVKSRSDAVGAVGNTNGSISSKVGMDGFGFDKEHSAEWNWSLTSSYKFWRKLFVSFQIPTTAPQ